MKSFDKFQFDSSPQIDEEMEDLDESIVGAVRSAGQVVGNSLKNTGQALQKAQKKAATLTSRAASKVQSVQKNLNKKIENVGNRVKDPLNRGVRPPLPQKDRATQKIEKKQADSLLNKSGSFTGVKPTRPLSQRQKDNKADAIAGLKAKGKLPSRFEGQSTETSKFRNLTRGGLRSSLARTAGSALLNVGKGLAQKPTRMVSFNQAGTGSLGAFQDLGQNFQGAAKGLMNTKRFQPTTSVKTGYNPGRGGNPPNDPPPPPPPGRARGGNPPDDPPPPPPPGGARVRPFRSNTPSKTTPGKDDGRTVGSTLLNKGLNAITNQRDSVSSKKKPVETPEPTGSGRLTQSKRTNVKDSDTLKFKPTSKEIAAALRSKNRKEVAQKITDILGNTKDPQSRQVKQQIRLAKKTSQKDVKKQAIKDFKADQAKNNLVNAINTGTTADGSKASEVVSGKKQASKTDKAAFDLLTNPKVNQNKLDDYIIKAKPGEVERQQNFIRKEPTSSQTTGTGNRGGQRRFTDFNRPRVTQSQTNKGGQTSRNNVLNKPKTTSKPTITKSQSNKGGQTARNNVFTDNPKTTTSKTNVGGQTARNNVVNRGENEMQKYRSDLRQDDENSKKKKNNKFSSNRPLRDEFEFSHWREEFLWEVDKKYPEKVKEIKPMSGKNNITVNPEDKDAKYKRGY